MSARKASTTGEPKLDMALFALAAYHKVLVLEVRVSKDEPMFKPIPDNDANETYEVVPASYPAGWWTVTAHGMPIRHFGDKGKAERYASDPEYRASVVSRRL